MTTTLQEVQAISDHVNRLMERLSTRHTEWEQLASHVLGDLVPPGTKLHASKASNDTWWYYLIMPNDWKPPEQGRRWIQNPNTYVYWDHGSNKENNTERGALVAGLRRLLEVL